MIIGKTIILGDQYDVISKEELYNNIEYYRNCKEKIAVLCDNYVLPLKFSNYNYTMEPGYYYNGGMYKAIFPTIDIMGMYVDDMIDYRDIKEFRDLVDARVKLDNIKKEYLCSSDNITKVPISENDKPLMEALKLFVNGKNIDINKYANRLEQPSNDKRKLNGNKISIDKFVNFIEALDGVAKIVIEDAPGDYPNKCGFTIEKTLTNVDGGE